MNSIDWKAVRDDYESGQLSQSALERKYGVSRQAIKKRAAKEKWTVPEDTGYRLPNSTTQRVQHRDVNATLRATHAMKMITEGSTYEDAAQRAGYGSRGACFHAVQRELERVSVPNVDNLRKLMSYRLDRLLSAVWPMAVPENTEIDDINEEGWTEDEESFDDPPREAIQPNLFAVDRVINIIKSQRELWGLDSPVANDGTGTELLIMEIPAGYLGDAQLPPEVKA